MRHLTRPGLMALLALLAASVALGGQARNAAERPAIPTDKPLEEMSIEELRTFQAYFYASGGRDPLTMRLPTVTEMGDANKARGEKKAPTIEEMDRIMDKAIEEVTEALKRRDYAAAIKASEDVIYIIDNEWPPLKADPPRLRQKDEQIRNLNRMATRLKMQEEIQKEFDSMHLRVEAVVWSPTDAKAVVNGKLMSAGEIMLEARKQGDLRIEIIEEHGVVFQFKGMRFRVPVELYTPPAGAVVK